MKYLPIVVSSLMKLLDLLESFFFTSINDLLQSLPGQLGADGKLADFLEKILSFFSKLSLGFVGDLTIFELLLGGGLIAMLTYKLILFLLPIAD